MTALATADAIVVFVDDVFAQGGRSTTRVPATGTVAEALAAAWPARWPQKPLQLVVIRNGERLEPDALLSPIAPGDIITAYPRVGAEAVGAAIIDFVAGAGTAEGLSSFVVQAVGVLAIQVVSFGVSLLLAPTARSLDTGENHGSNTHRWDGVTTDYAPQGAPKPVVVGLRTTGGSVISYVVRTTNGRSRLRLLLWISQGPTGGLYGTQGDLDGATGDSLPEGVLRLNDVDVTRWGSLVRVWTRSGRVDQTAIPGFNDATQPVTKNIALKPGAGNTLSHRASGPVDELLINLLFPKGLVGVFKGGELAYQRVSFRYRAREWVGGVATQWSTWTTFRAVGRSTTAFPWQETVEFTHASEWEVELERLDPIATDISHKDASSLESVTEVRYRGFVKPGAALLALDIRATEGLSGPRPQVEAKWKGWLTPVWDGASTTAPSFDPTWTRNPFWVCLGMLRDTIWGAGEALRLITYDVEEWQDAADWADELIAADLETTLTNPAAAGADRVFVTSSDGWAIGDRAYLDKGGAGEQLVTITELPTSGVLRFTPALGSTLSAATTIAKYHERCFYDDVFDTGESPWDLAQAILATARSRLSKIGNKLVLIRSVARDPVVVVSEGNVSGFQASLRSPHSQPTRIDMAFDDATQSYQRDTTSVEAEDVILDDDQESEFYDRRGYLVAQEFLRGVTRVEQARWCGLHRMRTLRLALWSASFTLPLEALAARDGSRIEIAHRTVKRTLVTGRVAEAASSGGSTVKLDRQVVIVGGTTYAITLRAGDDTVVTRTVSSTAGTYAPGDSLSISGTWPAAVAKYAPYSFGTQGSVTKSAEIVRYALREDLQVDIEVAEYVEAALADA